MESLHPFTYEKLRECLRYDEATGIFTWLIDRGKRARMGAPIRVTELRFGKNTYLSTCIYPKRYLVHRLAWFYMTGEWPIILIDHKNRIGTDNAWKNLREADHSKNAQNIAESHCDSTTGILGVYPLNSGRFTSRIYVNGKNRCLGAFDTPEMAQSAYLAAKRELHPFAMAGA